MVSGTVTALERTKWSMSWRLVAAMLVNTYWIIPCLTSWHRSLSWLRTTLKRSLSVNLMRTMEYISWVLFEGYYLLVLMAFLARSTIASSNHFPSRIRKYWRGSHLTTTRSIIRASPATSAAVISQQLLYKLDILQTLLCNMMYPVAPLSGKRWFWLISPLFTCRWSPIRIT